jgi:hypothetical protein
VKFTNAIQYAAKEFALSSVIEVGPHPALAGPIRYCTVLFLSYLIILFIELQPYLICRQSLNAVLASTPVILPTISFHLNKYQQSNLF